MIPYGKHDITEEDINAVTAVLRSDYLTQGAVVPQFENAVATVCGAQHAVACNSATSALHSACAALGVGVDDYVWTSAITFAASANCARYCGAKVDFVDIDPRSYNISIDALREKLSRAEQCGTLPKVLIVVHFAGQCCDMAAVAALAQQYEFAVIEDAAHAIGGSYRSEPVGNCHYSDITVFSFHPVKIITSGEGGMALTNNALLAEKMRLMRSHGITRKPELMTHSSEGEWYYQQLLLGHNYRMSDIHAALGLSQLTRLQHYVAQRTGLAQRYAILLKDLPLVLPWQAPDSASAWHLYVVQLDCPQPRNAVFNALRKAGIGVNLHYIPVYHHPYYQALGFVKGHCPEAEKYYDRALTIPLFATMNETQQQQVATALEMAVQS
ncbi:MAG: UDP-4-amino-4,6-dideoxy-N-acetyl-beta-L-altrosamine transaminase [Alphaproteobacteria bacterium]|nr:UDP-4-amino-4,6-dideoxy-N-acetyl-beta-L-altrosamine transaminase [Alphaproteobacteria bacterium]